MVSSLKAISSIRGHNFHVNIVSSCSGDIHSLNILLWCNRHCPRSWIDSYWNHVCCLKELTVQWRKWTFDQWFQWRVTEVGSGCCRRTGWVSGDLGGAGDGWWNIKEKEKEFSGMGLGLALALHSPYSYSTSGPSPFLSFSPGHPNRTVPIFSTRSIFTKSNAPLFPSKVITSMNTTLK